MNENMEAGPPPQQQPPPPRPRRPVLVYESKERLPARGGGDSAYILPMLTFLLLVGAGANATVKEHVPHAYEVGYVARTLAVAALLAYFWKSYTRIRWDYWWLGAVVGVVGIFQWVGMQLFLQEHVALFRPPDEADVFNPYRDIHSESARWAFIAVRVAGATLLVPVMEELFWRDYLWRQILAPNDFKLARVGEWGWRPFLGVSLAFAVVHGNWWLTSIVWAMMVGALLVYTKSLGACIIAHAVTNLLLAGYVLWYEDWAFW